MKRFIDTVLKFFILTFFLLGFNKASYSGEEMLLEASSGRLVQAAMYPIYVVFLKGEKLSNQSDQWVDKEYWASLDILEGKDKGKSVLFKLHVNSEASPQPEWCQSSDGEKYVGRGITCLNDKKTKEELRFKVNIQWAEDAPKIFKDRTFSEHPNVPGGIGGGHGNLGAVNFVIYKD